MARLRRTAVFVALSCNVGHDLVFRHYTNKVVVGKYPDTKTTKSSKQEKKRNKIEKEKIPINNG
jgi:hypothetical protein